jgi:hypothetical protein
LKRGNQTKELWENLKAEIKISNQREKYKSGRVRAGGRLRREGGVIMSKLGGKREKYVQVEKITDKAEKEKIMS